MFFEANHVNSLKVSQPLDPLKRLYRSPPACWKGNSYYTEDMSGAGIEEIEHTADWALRVRASELGSLFERAAQGMFSLIGSVATGSKPIIRPITLQAADLETLLVCWLEELLFLLEAENLMLVTARVQIPSPSQLFGTLELLPAAERMKEIKAVTFNELEVRQTSTGFEVAIVFDV